jgi:hypothetical protein
MKQFLKVAGAMFLRPVPPNAGHWSVNVEKIHKTWEIRAKGLAFTGGELPMNIDILNILARDRETRQMTRDR